MDVFEPGEKFRGYIVEKLLGSGALGAVWLARHEVMDVRFAIKVLHEQVAAGNPEFVRRFLREAKIAAKVRHPNMVAVNDAGYDDAKKLYYIVMEYVDGSTLRTALAMGGAMERGQAVAVVASVAGALAAGAPFGIVHRDIKPENIMIDRAGTVKLVDFGVAKASGTDSLRTQAKSVFGTPNYISPEQAQDSSVVDARADVYSLGVVFFELLCGRRPYECKNPMDVVAKMLSDDPVPDVREFNPAIDEPLARLVGAMLAKNRDERIASARAVLDELSAIGCDVRDAMPSPAAAPQPAAPDFDYSDIENIKTDPAFQIDTEDEDVKTYLAGVRARRRRALALRLALLLSAALALCAVLAAILRRLL